MTEASLLLDELRRRGWTLAVAESLTGGALAAEIVSVAGASDVFIGGVVAYATPVKSALLGVDPALLEREGAVHPEVARQMASGVRTALSVGPDSVRVGMATTGVAGPTSADGRPVGTVCIGVSVDDDTHAAEFHFDGDRAAIRRAAVDAAIAMARERLALRA